MSKSQPHLKAEKREALAKKLKAKNKNTATLAGQLVRFKTAQKYQGKKTKSKS